MKTKEVKSLFTGQLLVVWLILCIFVFIYFPGRFSSLYISTLDNWPKLLSRLGGVNSAGYILSLLRSFLGILLFASATISVGSTILMLLLSNRTAKPLSDLHWLGLLGSAFIIGQGSLAMAFFALAKFGKFTAINTGLILLVGLALGAWPLFNLVSRHPAKKDIFQFIKTTARPDKILIWLAVCILVASMMYSSARLSYDSVALYFSNAKIIALTHHIQYFLNDSFFVSSLQVGMNYAALIQIFGDQAARLYSWISGIVIIGFGLAIGEETALTKRARIILMVLILTSTAFLDLMGDGKIDLASTAPAMGAVYWMAISTKKQTSIAFIISGLMAGLAMISRPFNFFLLTVFFGFYYLQYIYLQKRKTGNWDFERILQNMFWICIGAIGLIAYYLVANWAVTGDALTPLKDFQRTNASVWQWTINPHLLWIIRLLYPFSVTYVNNPQSLGNISPLFIAFLPGVLLKNIRARISEELGMLLIAAVLTLLLWIAVFFTIFEIRYVLFLWMILLMITSVTIDNVLDVSNCLLVTVTRISMIFLMAFITLRAVYVSLDTYSPLNSQGNPQCYGLTLCNFLKPINDVAPQGARVLTLNAYRYYLRTDLFACSTKHNEYQTLQNLSLGNDEAFWREVYRQGYKFIAYENNYTVRHLRLGLIPNPNTAPAWLTLKPLYGKPGDPEVAYEILVKEPPVQVEEGCRRTNAGIWKVQPLSTLGK